MAKRLVWGEEGHAKHVPTIEELDAALDDLDKRARSEGPIMVELYLDDGSSLSIGLGHDATVLDYVGPEGDPPYWRSTGSADKGEPLAFYYRGDFSEFPPGSGVPLEKGRNAMREFHQTGELSSSFEWKST